MYRFYSKLIVRFKQLLGDFAVHLRNIKTADVVFFADAVQKFHSAIAINSRIFISTTTNTAIRPLCDST